jgi:cell division protein FtsQ
LPSKNRRRKRPLKTKDKIKRFLALTLIACTIIITTTVAIYGDVLLKRSFPLKDIDISGNRHYTEKKIISKMGINKGDCLLFLSLKDMAHTLLSERWIKGVFIRKVLPSTLIVKITEATPMALISQRGRLYLIDEDGLLLARIKGDKGAFLPILTGMNLRKDSEKIREALKLVKSLKLKGVLTQNNMIRISATKDYGLVMDINSEVVRIGYGNYSSKLDYWMRVSSEIKNQQMDVVYLDVRFKEQVVVEPIKSIK